MFDVTCSCYICFNYVLVVAYNLGSCVDCRSIYICRTPNIEHFRMLYSFELHCILYFLLSLQEVKETIKQKWCKALRH